MAQEGSGNVPRIKNLADGPGLFERLLNDGDLDGFVNLYEPDAVLVSENGRTAEGRAAIRESLEELLRERPTFTIARRSAIRSGALVLAVYDWTLTGRGPEGAVQSAGGTGAIVFHQQPDGAWLAVLDNMPACD